MKLRRSRKVAAWLLLIVSAVTLVAGLALLFTKSSPSTQLTVQADQPVPPTVTKPTQQEVDNYVVPPNSPRYIYIPTINIDKTRITHLGVDKNKRILTPANINDTSWYSASAQPGQPGEMFIYGHVSSWQANGIFYNLHKLKTGDKITIERGDGKKFTYEVRKTKTYPADKVNMNEVLAPVDPKVPGLSLMTCAGTVKPGTSEFTERLVVFASIVAN